MNTCRICNAEDYVDGLCFWCWWHTVSFNWTEDACREHEAIVAEIAREHDYDRYHNDSRGGN